MDSSPDDPPFPQFRSFVLAVAASAALWWFGTDLQPHAWAAWLAPLPVLAFALRARAAAATLAAALAWSIGGANHLAYLAAVHVPVPLRALAVVLPALVFALAALLARALARKRRFAWAALAVPSIWIGIEYFNAATSPHGTAFALAYSQMDVMPVIQVAALGGPWAIGFLVLLPCSALAVASLPQATSAQRLRLLAGTGLVVAGAFGFGEYRLHAASDGRIITEHVGLASIQSDPRVPSDTPAGQALLRQYLASANRLVDAGARLIVLPETAFAADASGMPAFARFARERGVTLVAGIDERGGPDGERNAAELYAPAQARPVTYAKRHLIPFLEDRYRPGNATVVLEGTPRIGLAVCKDMDFTATGRDDAQHGARLLAVPAWDFEVDAWLHSRMAILRGVEGGFAIARAARDGSLTLSDDRGRVVAAATAIGAGTTSVASGVLRAGDGPTPYARIGDVFAWFVLALAGGCILFAWIPGMRSTR